MRNIRDSKTFGFLVVNDGTYFEPLQVVFHDAMANFSDICHLNVGAAVIVKGQLVATPKAKQPFEIQAETLRSRMLPHRIIRCSRRDIHLNIFVH